MRFFALFTHIIILQSQQLRIPNLSNSAITPWREKRVLWIVKEIYRGNAYKGKMSITATATSLEFK